MIEGAGRLEALGGDLGGLSRRGGVASLGDGDFLFDGDKSDAGRAEGEGAGGVADEVAAVHVVGADELVDLVVVRVFDQALVAVRVKVVGPHKGALLAARDRERPRARHHVADRLARLEQLAQPRVLRAQSRVPVDLGVVEVKRAFLLFHGNVHVRVAGEKLVVEGAEVAVRADLINLIDHGAHVGLLVNQNTRDYVPILSILLPEVEMC